MDDELAVPIEADAIVEAIHCLLQFIRAHLPRIECSTPEQFVQSKTHFRRLYRRIALKTHPDKDTDHTFSTEFEATQLLKQIFEEGDLLDSMQQQLITYYYSRYPPVVQVQNSPPVQPQLTSTKRAREDDEPDAPKSKNRCDPQSPVQQPQPTTSLKRAHEDEQQTPNKKIRFELQALRAWCAEAPALQSVKESDVTVLNMPSKRSKKSRPFLEALGEGRTLPECLNYFAHNHTQMHMNKPKSLKTSVGTSEAAFWFAYMTRTGGPRKNDKGAPWLTFKSAES